MILPSGRASQITAPHLGFPSLCDRPQQFVSKKQTFSGAVFIPASGPAHQGYLSASLLGHCQAYGSVNTSSEWAGRLPCFGEWAGKCIFTVFRLCGKYVAARLPATLTTHISTMGLHI